MVLCGTNYYYHPFHRRIRQAWGERKSQWCELVNYMKTDKCFLLYDGDFNSLSPHCFFSKDSLRFEAIESFLQRKTSKLLTDFCVLHTKWVRIIKHFLGWVYFSRIIVHLQICDPEKLRRGHVPALWNMVAVGIPCQLANNQTKKCLFFPKPEFLEHRWPIHCFKGERFLMRPCSYGSEPI